MPKVYTGMYVFRKYSRHLFSEFCFTKIEVSLNTYKRRFNLLLMRLLLAPNSTQGNNCILENGVNTEGRGIHVCPSEWTIFPTSERLLGHFLKDSIDIWL